MAAEDNLSRALFHGSMVELKPGDVIKPVDRSYGTPLAFATDNHGAAKAFATNDKTGEKGHIYHVEPVDHTDVSEPRPIKGFKYGNEVLSKTGFRVVKKVPRKMSSDQINSLNKSVANKHE